MNAAMVLNKRNRMELDNVKLTYSNIQRTILHLAKGIHLRKENKMQLTGTLTIFKYSENHFTPGKRDTLEKKEK